VVNYDGSGTGYENIIIAMNNVAWGSSLAYLQPDNLEGGVGFKADDDWFPVKHAVRSGKVVHLSSKGSILYSLPLFFPLEEAWRFRGFRQMLLHCFSKIGIVSA
jgi:hypothetical protein